VDIRERVLQDVRFSRRWLRDAEEIGKQSEPASFVYRASSVACRDDGQVPPK
jgi:hypothetical protein